MRFRNSSDYFGLATYARHWMTRNSATGKAFRAFKERIAVTPPHPSFPRIGSSTATKSAVIVRSKVTSHGY
jgi:hypothetical protein